MEQNIPPTLPPKREGLSASFLMSDNAALQDMMLRPSINDSARVNEQKIRRLYLQASAQQWFAPTKINFEPNILVDDETRRIWIRFVTIFYTLEKMGLNVIANMMPKASAKLKSDEISYYLSAQCFDESRHVFVLENYLKKLGAPVKYDYKYHVLGQAASMGFYRVENWLFSTLFSENFAHAFLRRAKVANIDPMGAEICKSLQADESRHLHFLHIVLPDIMDRLNLFGRTYVKSAQFFIMKFTETVSRTLDSDAKFVGLDRRAMFEEVFENVERAYESFGVTRSFLPFPKISSTVN